MARARPTRLDVGDKVEQLWELFDTRMEELRQLLVRREDLESREPWLTGSELGEEGPGDLSELYARRHEQLISRINALSLELTNMTSTMQRVMEGGVNTRAKAGSYMPASSALALLMQFVTGTQPLIRPDKINDFVALIQVLRVDFQKQNPLAGEPLEQVESLTPGVGIKTLEMVRSEKS